MDLDTPHSSRGCYARVSLKRAGRLQRLRFYGPYGPAARATSSLIPLFFIVFSD